MTFQLRVSWLYVSAIQVIEKFLLLPQYKLSDPIRELKLKHVVVYEYILNEFSVMYCGIKVKVTNVMHCGIKVKVTIALAKFNHLLFQITSRWLFIAESEKVIAKYTSIYTVYKSIYTVLYNLVCSCGKAKLVTK